MPVDPSNLKAIMAASSKKFGEGRVRFGSEVAEIDRISWGSLELDMATWGGAPMGRVIRPWGGKHTAKSLIAWGLVKSAQEHRSDKYPDGLTCVYFNAEGQYDPHFTKEFMGVDTDKLVVEEGSIIEEITAKAAAYLDVAHILIIDSIGHCQSRAQYELDPAKGATKGARGTQAVAWGQFLKHVIERMDKHENMIVAIDQVRTNQTYGQEVASGSNIWDHCSSMDLHHRKVANLYQQADGSLGPDRPQKPHYQTMGQEVLIDGFEIGIEVNKSRVCRPFGKYRGRLGFEDMQWDRNFELKKVALYLGVVTQSGAYFSVDGESKSMHGHKQFDQRLDEDPSLVMKIYGAVDKYFKDNGYGKVK